VSESEKNETANHTEVIAQFRYTIKFLIVVIIIVIIIIISELLLLLYFVQ